MGFNSGFKGLMEWVLKHTCNGRWF